MGNMMLILQKKPKGDMRNNRAVTLAPPPCTSAEAILETHGTNSGVTWTHRRAAGSLGKGKPWLSSPVTFLEGVWTRAEKRHLYSPLACPKTFPSPPVKPLKEIVSPCDTRKGPTQLNMRLHNGVTQTGHFYQEKCCRNFTPS